MSESASRGSSKLVYRSPFIGSGVAWCSFNSRRTFALSVPINKSTNLQIVPVMPQRSDLLHPARRVRPGVASRACQTKTSKL